MQFCMDALDVFSGIIYKMMSMVILPVKKQTWYKK